MGSVGMGDVVGCGELNGEGPAEAGDPFDYDVLQSAGIGTHRLCRAGGDPRRHAGARKGARGDRAMPN